MFRVAVIRIASAEIRRIPVAVEIQRPLSELEVLLGLRRAIEDLSLEILIPVKDCEGENDRRRNFN